MQSHLPVREQVTAEGHSVRALYLYSGMADLALETKEEKLTEICQDPFEKITEKRMYITGWCGVQPAAANPLRLIMISRNIRLITRPVPPLPWHFSAGDSGSLRRTDAMPIPQRELFTIRC